MHRFYFLLIFITFFGNKLTAQQAQTNDSTYNYSPALGTIVNIRGTLPNFKAYNTLLKKDGYPELGTPVFDVQFGKRFELIKNPLWIFEASVNAMPLTSSNTRKVTATRTTGVSYQFFGASFLTMYDATPKTYFTKILPYFGVNANIHILKIYDRLPSTGSITTYQSSNTKVWRFVGYTPGIEVGMSIEQGFRLNYTDIFIGLRGGAEFQFLSKWYFDGGVPTNLPESNLEGFYGALTLRALLDGNKYEEFVKSNSNKKKKRK